MLCIIAHIDSLLRQPLLVPEPSLSLSLFPTSYSLEFSASLKIFLRLSCATAIASFLLTTLKSLSLSLPTLSGSSVALVFLCAAAHLKTLAALSF